jgi:transposase
MPSALSLRTDYLPADLRRLAKKTKDNNQSRRLLSLAAVLDGMNRTDAARIRGMDRQTLRDWVHRFNDLGLDGLFDVHAGLVEPRLIEAQKQVLVEKLVADAAVEALSEAVLHWLSWRNNTNGVPP